MDISNVGGIRPSSNRGVGKSEQADQPRHSAPAAAGSGSSADRVEISSSAREAQKISALVEQAKREPEVRQDVVDDAARMIDNGGTLRDEVARQLASRIVDAIL